jgi:hypothetical protein
VSVLERAASSFWLRRNPEGRGVSKERTAPSEEQGLGGKNPMGGTGMEQARKAVRGARRREGEKPCGRNVTGELGSAGIKWLLAV